MSVIQGTWGAASFHYGTWNSGLFLIPSQYAEVQFEVYSANGGSFAVRLEDDGGNSFPAVSCGNAPAAQWMHVSLPMNTLNPSALNFNRIDILETSGSPRTYYLDNVQLTQTPAVSGGLMEQSDGSPSGGPAIFALDQNFPNPFPTPTRAATCIWFDLAQPGEVTLDILNLRGGVVRRLIPGSDFPAFLPAGRYGRGNTGTGLCDPRLTWDGRADDGDWLPAGVYLYKLKFGGVIQFKRIVYRGRTS